MADDISEILRAWSEGDQTALDKLTPIGTRLPITVLRKGALVDVVAIPAELSRRSPAG